jgi:hypothetical protein
MPNCQYCGSELEPLPTLSEAEAVWWVCPNNCEFDALPKPTLEEILIGAETALRYPEPTPTTHCWTSSGNGTRCPGVVVRTEETRDGPYGNFCPVCGYSLKYNPIFGEGKPKDMAKKWKG